MIETKFGDMLAATEGILVHGCNCQGIMGSGIARLVREKWPDVHQAYRNRHIQSGLQLGEVIFVGSSQAPAVITQKYLHAVTAQLPTSLIVANAMTQFTCGSDKNMVYVDYDAVFAAFARINLLARDSGLTVNFPLRRPWHLLSSWCSGSCQRNPGGFAQNQFSCIDCQSLHLSSIFTTQK